METSVELFDYGIHNESSDIRAHVAVYAKTLFVFPTVCAVRVMEKYPLKPAFQNGVNGPTAEGHCVVPSEIDGIRRLRISDERLVGFDEGLSTTDKGNRAVDIVSAFLKAGRFPLWLEGEFVKEVDIQRTGTDLKVQGRWRIEVKCDFRASDMYGIPHPRCTGRLFLQIRERNPLHHF